MRLDSHDNEADDTAPNSAAEPANMRLTKVQRETLELIASHTPPCGDYFQRCRPATFRRLEQAGYIYSYRGFWYVSDSGRAAMSAPRS